MTPKYHAEIAGCGFKYSEVLTDPPLEKKSKKVISRML
jgi:hypothetical protein